MQFWTLEWLKLSNDLDWDWDWGWEWEMGTVMGYENGEWEIGIEIENTPYPRR